MDRKGTPFGHVADVLYQIVTSSDMATALNLCLVNKSTYETIKVLEPHICRWFMRSHNVDTFSSVLTLDPETGSQIPLTVHTLPKFIRRQQTASQIACRIIPSVWGPFSDYGYAGLDYSVELRLAKRLERGLYVLFHFADISHIIERRQEEEREFMASTDSERLLVLAKTLDKYDDVLQHKRQFMTFDEHISHIYSVLEWGQMEADIGRKRIEFRGFIDAQTETDFHAALRILRELLERMLLRHGPKDWHRDANNEYSVISWFLLRQTPRTLAKLFLSPQDECCRFDDKSTGDDTRECIFSDPLDNYWKEWKDDPGLGCRDCDCKRRVRSWSVRPAVIDARGREFNRAAQRYLKEMWCQRHIGPQQESTFCCYDTF
ncbi:uncharacterized protein ACLA_002260 [Aspergillus clavatus NRRL 1]|uniref:SNARE domain protein n=1 Tax=Aspergillus clavatus (strain ATCC 1007 / CBS 513.65 / DSM 816 / NCTC 3887 / NRRL 1 / QM 1276 / 107) TaxID=344612 RepID=A1C547_ASPCL|nr:uncharacterized protein ACLA_002260 [Aspergillus clavatus NRRL 1]EAW14815.1 hypothetical protein ACLA_002260 [Aspergillus clavatus NRRL 1]